MRRFVPILAAVLALGLGLAVAVVQAQRPPARQGQTAQPAKPLPPVIERDLSALPPAVAKMRDRLIEAARSGEFEAMRLPIEVNELPPMFLRDAKAPGDAMSRLKSLSADANGRQVMARILNLLDHGFAILEKGRAGEVYVFPWFAEAPFESLTPADWVDIWRILPADKVKAMADKKLYSGDRLALGKDGTWHYFLAGE
jgi:hypothetical protein